MQYPPLSTLHTRTVASALPETTREMESEVKSAVRNLTQWTSSSWPSSRTNGFVSVWSSSEWRSRSQMSANDGWENVLLARSLARSVGTEGLSPNVVKGRLAGP